MIHLPGLACLNKPVALRPIVEKLPLFLKSIGEKQIMECEDKHDDAYPQFSEFSNCNDHPEPNKKEKSPKHYGGSTLSRRLQRAVVLSVTGEDLSLSVEMT